MKSTMITLITSSTDEEVYFSNNTKIEKGLDQRQCFMVDLSLLLDIYGSAFDNHLVQST